MCDVSDRGHVVVCLLLLGFVLGTFSRPMWSKFKKNMSYSQTVPASRCCTIIIILLLSFLSTQPNIKYIANSSFSTTKTHPTRAEHHVDMMTQWRDLAHRGENRKREKHKSITFYVFRNYDDIFRIHSSTRNIIWVSTSSMGIVDKLLIILEY